ncbi:MAG TPA: hypothetical protein VIQ23_11260 [Hanamia sp.]
MPDELKEKVGSKRRLQIKKNNAAKYAATKLRMGRYSADVDLKNWFKFHMINSKMVCENCGEDLSHYNENDWKGCQHHVLEKSIFHSVSTVLNNHVVLGKWCCHSQFHTSMLNASKMNIFDKCTKIVNELYPLLTNEEKGKISEYYNIKFK